jgi:hypothetical protein
MTQAQNFILLADSPDSLRDLLAPMFTDFLTANLTGSLAANLTAPLATNPPVPTVTHKEFMTKEDLCLEFGISSTTATEWMKKGFIPFLRYDRRVYFERSAVIEAGRRHTKYTHSKSK